MNLEQTNELIDAVALRFMFRLRVSPKAELVSSILRRTGRYSLNDLKILERYLNEGGSFLDVGANLGWYSLVASKIVGSTGLVYAFEPELRNLELLRANREENEAQNIEVFPFALTDEISERDLSLSEENWGDHSLISSPTENHSLVGIQTKRLTDCMSAEQFARVSLIKVDIQGAEPSFLRGAESFLRDHKPPIMMEYSPSHLHQTGSSPFEIFAFMDRFGYLPYLIHDERGSTWDQLLEPISIDHLLSETRERLSQGRFDGLDLLLLTRKHLPL